MKAIFKYYGPAILWALFIFIMCSIKISNNLSDSPLFFPGFDKIVHSGFFLVMTAFISYGVIRQQSPRTLSYKALLLITIIVIAYGGLIELLQYYIFTWRSGDWNDLFADITGALMGAFSIMLTVKATGYAKK